MSFAGDQLFDLLTFIEELWFNFRY
jgi:hypothetical protein